MSHCKLLRSTSLVVSGRDDLERRSRAMLEFANHLSDHLGGNLSEEIEVWLEDLEFIELLIKAIIPCE